MGHRTQDVEPLLSTVKRTCRKWCEDREALTQEGSRQRRGCLPRLACVSPLDCGQSPAELLFGRKIRTRLPYRFETYTRKSAPHDHGKLLTVLHPNDTVRVKDPRRRRWSGRAGVVGLSGPRSCDVQCEDGRRMRRNRQHLLATRETFKPFHTECVTLPDNATQQSTVSTPATAIETHADAETEEIDEVTELSEHTSSLSSSPVRRRSERVRKAPVRLDL